MKNKFRMRKVAMILFFVPLALFAFSTVVMLLWNAILPEVANVSRINFWQALGILVLSKILFGGFRGGWGGGPRHHWKERMENKLSGMTPEDKEKFKQAWRNRCAGWGRPNPEQFSQSKPKEPSQSTTD